MEKEITIHGKSFEISDFEKNLQDALAIVDAECDRDTIEFQNFSNGYGVYIVKNSCGAAEIDLTYDGFRAEDFNNINFGHGFPKPVPKVVIKIDNLNCQEGQEQLECVIRNISEMPSRLKR